MASYTRRWLIAGLLAASLLTMACNPVAMTYFLLVGLDPKHDPDCTAFRNRKDSKVVILVSAPVDTRQELVHADRELGHIFAQQFQAGITANKDKIRIASPAKVTKYLEEHPSWQTMDMSEIGKDLDADFVIHLQINSLSLFEEGSMNQLYRGKAAISVEVFDAAKAGEPSVYRKEYDIAYPRSRGAIPVTDANLQAFKFAFLKRVATDLTWLFTAHPTADDYHCD